jgi:hypothetical protein
MGKIRCEKHGDQGIVLTCAHVRQDILMGTSTIGRLVTIDAVVEFVNQSVAYCDTCAKQYDLSLTTFGSHRATHKLPRGGSAIESNALDTVGQS